MRRAGLSISLTFSLALLSSGCGPGSDTSTSPEPKVSPIVAQRLLTPQTVHSAWQSPAKLTEVCHQAIERAKQTKAELLASTGAERTVANTLTPLDDMERALDDISGVNSIMMVASPDPKARDAAGDCSAQISAFFSDLSLNRSVYDLVATLPTEGLDADTKHFHNEYLKGFRRSGVDRDEPTRTRLAQLNAQLGELSRAFGKNIREDRRIVLVENVDELKGLPQDYIDQHPANAQGKIELSTDYPDLKPVLAYADSRDLRHKLYHAYRNVGYPANENILLDVLKLRREKATLLGYDSWNAYAASDMMAKDVETIQGFIEDLVETARPIAKKESSEVLKYLQTISPEIKELYEADAIYARNKISAQKFGVDNQEVRKFFGYSNVRNGILKLYGELFNLEFVPIEGDVWHETVEYFSMRRDGKELGRFYLDMHPRDGKYKHAAMYQVHTGNRSGRLPVATLLCNFPNPRDGGPALMEHGEVGYFFHEFGHLIHHLLATRSQWLSENGISAESDFTEAPSQILEEWIFDPDVLARFATHAETGEPITREFVQNMQAAADFGKGQWATRQLFFAAFSHYLHLEDPETLNLEEYSARIFRDYHTYKRPQGLHLFASNGHIMGYSSVVYTYQWSMMLSKDLFTRFQKEGLVNPSVMQEYGDKVLAPGGMKPAAQLVEDFLGRPYSLEAYKSWLTK